MEAPLPLPLFWKCVKRKGFKSFVLKVRETKGFADAFLRKCVNLKSLARKAEGLEQEGRQGIERHDSRGVGSKALAVTVVFPLLFLTATAFSGGSYCLAGSWRLLHKYLYHNERRLSRALGRLDSSKGKFGA